MSSTDPTIDPYTHFGFIKNSDGSVTRAPKDFPTSPASSDPSNAILSKDIPINEEKNTWARVYLPRPETTAGAAASTAKLPLIIYFHGGGFVLASPAFSLFHKLCTDIASRIPAVIVSVEYRLAPEHRLPAAYDDGAEALQWIAATADDWLTQFADFSKCFLMGDSAGGNLVYHLALRAITFVDGLTRLRIRGLILHQPFFGGVGRTLSEIRLANNEVIPLIAADVLWDLALPVEADRDHEYCNPMVAVRLDLLEKVKERGWRFLVTGREGDPLVDRQIQFVKMLREVGIEVFDKFSEGGSHGIELFDESQAEIYYGVLKDFVLSF